MSFASNWCSGEEKRCWRRFFDFYIIFFLTGVATLYIYLCTSGRETYDLGEPSLPSLEFVTNLCGLLYLAFALPSYCLT